MRTATRLLFALKYRVVFMFTVLVLSGAYFLLLPYKINTIIDESHILSSCNFSHLVNGMFRESDAGALLHSFDENGGANVLVRKLFLKRLFTLLHFHGVHFWAEGGCLVQAVRNVTAIPGEPAFLPFDDIDIGIRDVELKTRGSLVNALRALHYEGFKIIRCTPSAFSIARDGDYVDVMIFSSNSSCPIREPNSAKVCSVGIAPYVLHTHNQSWEFLDGVPISLPGKSLVETSDYLEAMFGSNWQEHDRFDWRTPGNRGDSTDWAKTDARLVSKLKRFSLGGSNTKISSTLLTT